jgi:ceramide glucosyltransferase
MTVADIILALAIVAGMAFQVAGALLLRRFAARPAADTGERPPVTILKPLCGAEAGLVERLASFWRSDWPGLRLVCGVADAGDPAVAAVRELRHRLPDADIRLVVGGPHRATNAKVANLMNMLAEAGDGILVIADSDMTAPPGYLEAVLAALEPPDAGLATCLYVGHAEGGPFARLGAMGINHGFLPAGLVARALGRADGCFGATMALRRATLERAGGLRACGEALADDYELGRRVRDLGLRLALAPVLVRTRVAESGLPPLFDHELRWSRTVASVAPFSALAAGIVQPALAWAALCGPWPLLPLALACRWWAVDVQARALGLASPPPWAIAARDLLSLAVFAVTFCGRSVSWRGRRYRIRADGSLEAQA